MLTVLETWQFAKEAERLFTEDERQELIEFLAWNPTIGVEIVGSGGLRKLRFRSGGRGKSGGARVIYFFHNEDIPLYLIACFGKSQKSNLSRAEVNAFAAMTVQIKARYRKRQQ